MHPQRGKRPLSKAEFLKRLKSATRDFKFEGPEPKGHSLHIGGTLFYLLHGRSFEVVKLLGRWKGDSYRLYLRKHATIMAPYLQHDPELFRHLHTIILPPVR